MDSCHGSIGPYIHGASFRFRVCVFGGGGGGGILSRENIKTRFLTPQDQNESLVM